MGHAGAIVGGHDDTAAAKMAIMRECGLHVVESPAEIGAKMVEALAQNRNLRTLEIKGQTISHLEMKRLLKMPSLRKLTVFGYKWNEENLAALRDESHIKFLAVSEDDIPEMRLRLLTRAKHLAGMEIGEVSSYKMKARLLAMQPYLVDASGKKIELMVTLKSKVLYAL